MVSVDVKYHVYSLAYCLKVTSSWGCERRIVTHTFRGEDLLWRRLIVSCLCVSTYVLHLISEWDSVSAGRISCNGIECHHVTAKSKQFSQIYVNVQLCEFVWKTLSSKHVIYCSSSVSILLFVFSITGNDQGFSLVQCKKEKKKRKKRKQQQQQKK